MSLISAENAMAVMAALFVIAGLGFVAEKTRVGAQLTGAVIAIVTAIAAANLNIIPHSSPAYDFVFSYFVPILIPLFLFKADLKRLMFETTRTTMAFLLASVGTVAGVTLAALSLDLTSLGALAPLAMEQREAAVAGLFASTYIGGSVNYAALGEVTGLSQDASFFSAATAADNLFSAVYLGLLALLPGWRWLAQKYQPHDHSFKVDELEDKQPITAMSLVLALAAAMVIVAVGDAVLAYIGGSGWRYIVITVLSLVLATLAPALVERMAGSFELGVGLSFVFFAAIAAGADVVAMVQVAPLLIALVLILLSMHFVVTFTLGRWLGLSMPELITASNAAILGATTAPALAAAKGWNNLITPGILVGVFGYALGTFVGTFIFKFWGLFL
ncbi:DUF819 family protein [Dasania sp. GY-MA-18]|uniref:DUF819 family protein n=1 Tax=Dasania phycosphaerae TaxID=2950436 RepID=A0A9J6RN51_9GAMM|nr:MULTISPECIES: DUF819 family protein [Dasania]MCR8923716.1 DUF819 family protein [Dasania sp. GY-MA-18]MCZ0866150.1 DUF819 family protein [Dasania phycosphaerae]MCZ0869874.1 DUF819 family protein [Dasania phycosphaerae]